MFSYAIDIDYCTLAYYLMCQGLALVTWWDLIISAELPGVIWCIILFMLWFSLKVDNLNTLSGISSTYYVPQRSHVLENDRLGGNFYSQSALLCFFICCSGSPKAFYSIGNPVIVNHAKLVSTCFSLKWRGLNRTQVIKFSLSNCVCDFVSNLVNFSAWL